MHETALPMVIMFHTSLVIHGRSKLSCFGADKRQVLPRWKWNFDWSNKFREKHKTQCENNIFHHNAKKKVCGREDEKDVMFISSMVLQWIMTFCTYQQKLKTCMKPQFQWEKCCTHVWPSTEDVCKFIIFLRGQTPSLSAPTLILSLMEHFEGKIQCKINILQIHTNKLQLVSGEPPAFALYIYIYTYIYILYIYYIIYIIYYIYIYIYIYYIYIIYIIYNILFIYIIYILHVERERQDIHTYIHKHTYIHTYVYIYILYVYIYIYYMYIYTHMYMGIMMCVHTNIHIE